MIYSLILVFVVVNFIAKPATPISFIGIKFEFFSIHALNAIILLIGIFNSILSFLKFYRWSSAEDIAEIRQDVSQTIGRAQDAIEADNKAQSYHPHLTQLRKALDSSYRKLETIESVEKFVYLTLPTIGVGLMLLFSASKYFMVKLACFHI